MNPNDMTIEAIRDELAGLRFVDADIRERVRELWRTGEHPIPATLDEAMRLPPGWTWLKFTCGQEDINAGQIILAAENRESLLDVEVPVTGHDLESTRLDFFRLRLACTLADEGSKT